MKQTIRLNEKEVKGLVKKCIAEYLTETSRRQKAIQSLNGTNNKIRTLAILTSENPVFKDIMDVSDNRDTYGDKNTDRREDLEKALRIGHYAWFPVKGHYGEKPERSYMIYNISLEDALYLGRKYGQQSIIYINDGNSQFWEQDGNGKFKMTHERPMHTRIDMSNADDLYTQVSRAYKFQIPFFDGSDENAEELVNMNEYVCNTINKRILNESEVDRRIQTCLTAKSGFNRYVNHSELYGNNFQWGLR